MPSDTPPPRPFGLLRPGAGASASTGAAAGASQAAATPANAGAPTILNPNLRRFWQRESEALEDLALPGRRGTSGSVAWVALVAMALIAAVLIRQGPGLLEPPPRVLTPLPPGLILPPPGPRAEEAEPALRFAFGPGAIMQGGARVARVGRAAEHAITCGLRKRVWVNDARDALVKDIAAQYPSFEDDPANLPRLRQYLAARFQHGQRLAPQDLNERGQQEICDNLRYAPEFGQLNNAASQADIRVE